MPRPKPGKRPLSNRGDCRGSGGGNQIPSQTGKCMVPKRIFCQQHAERGGGGKREEVGKKVPSDSRELKYELALTREKGDRIDEIQIVK